MNPQSDCTTPTKKQTKALHQAQRRADPVKRRLEQSSNTVQRRSARTNQAVQEHESEQQAAAREEPGVREHKSEQRAAAREVYLQWENDSNESHCHYYMSPHLVHSTLSQETGWWKY